MSETQKQEARRFAEAFKTLPETDKRYLEGWLDAKADTNDQRKKAE